MSIPRGAFCIIEGIYYKIGIGGRSFRWNGYEWRTSSIKPATINKQKSLAKQKPNKKVLSRREFENGGQGD